MPIHNNSSNNETSKANVSKIHRESFLFGFLGLFIFIFSRSFFMSIVGYISLYFIYTAFKSHQQKSIKIFNEIKYNTLKKSILFRLKISILPIFPIILFAYLDDTHLFKILFIIYISIIIYAIFYYLPILLLNLIILKIKSSSEIIQAVLESIESTSADTQQPIEEKPQFTPKVRVQKPRIAKAKQPTQFEFNPRDALLTQMFELKQYFQSELGLRHRRQLNELHQIFQDIENKNTTTYILITQRQALKKTQEICLEQTLAAIKLFLNIPKEQRLRFNQDLNSVPDLWFTQALNKCIANLLKEIEPLYTHDLQSLLDHQNFLQQSLKQEHDFKIDKK